MLIQLIFLEGSVAQLDWGGIIQTGGIIGVLATVGTLIMRRKLVPGWTYEAMVEERDYYRKLANRGVEVAERQADISEKLAESLFTNRAANRLQAQSDLYRGRGERDDERFRD